MLAYPDNLKYKLQTDKILIKSYGGQIVEDDEAEVSTVVIVCDIRDAHKYKVIQQQLLTAGNKIFDIVSPEWFYQCINQSKLISTSNFHF